MISEKTYFRKLYKENSDSLINFFMTNIMSDKEKAKYKKLELLNEKSIKIFKKNK